MAQSESNDSQFRFAISLSVLNHLGRNLYRNFITVLGEAISNSWDAEAENVWIDVDLDNRRFSIKDDGIGMDREDFQEKFLKIGYSKRSEGKAKSELKKRPYIGAKGIGKLALLSCAKRVSVFSKKIDEIYVGGVIDNSGLDQAITDDIEHNRYPLEILNFDLIAKLEEDHRQGTILVFEDINERLRNTLPQLRKLLAMSFRFSLIDEKFSIYVNKEKVTIFDLEELMGDTQFIWLINQYEDDFVDALRDLPRDAENIKSELEFKGLIATVAKPGNLTIRGADDSATLDLFVNGRIRERNILKHIPTHRIVENYIYGQIHFDGMDREGEDPFTSSREGIQQDDEIFKKLLAELKEKIVPKVIDDWDKFRLKLGEEGDDENTRIAKKLRKAQALFRSACEDYVLAENSPNKSQVDKWLKNLSKDATFNLSAYIDCFVSENLVRNYITEHGIPLDQDKTKIVQRHKKSETKNKKHASINFDLRSSNDDTVYLDMREMASAIVDKEKTTPPNLESYSGKYIPVRNVVAHTGLLTNDAKEGLNNTFKDIKENVKILNSKVPVTIESSDPSNNSNDAES